MNNRVYRLNTTHLFLGPRFLTGSVCRHSALKEMHELHRPLGMLALSPEINENLNLSTFRREMTVLTSDCSAKISKIQVNL